MAFDRLLARLIEIAPERWLLKGAVALDFRLGDRARATADLDLFHQENELAATKDLIAAQSLDLGDFFTFQIERTSKLDNLEGGAAVRYRVEAGLDGRRFEFVTLDVGFDLHYAAKPDLLTGPTSSPSRAFHPFRYRPSRWKHTLPRSSTPMCAFTAMAAAAPG